MRTILLLLISATCYAQPNVEIGLNNHGGRLGGSYVEPSTGIVLSAVHNFPLVRFDKPHTTMLSAGYEHLMGDFNATFLAGAAFNAYNANGKEIGLKNNTKAMGSVEVGWDKHLGRLFTYGSYTGQWYVGLGMKIKLE